jgi:hypothetical protein
LRTTSGVLNASGTCRNTGDPAAVSFGEVAGWISDAAADVENGQILTKGSSLRQQSREITGSGLEWIALDFEVPVMKILTEQVLPCPRNAIVVSYWIFNGRHSQPPKELFSFVACRSLALKPRHKTMIRA